jgi:hypothetical protein
MFKTSLGYIEENEDMIQQAREFAAKPYWDAVKATLKGELKPNYPGKYVSKMKSIAADIEAGLFDSNFSTWQRMNYFLTGESVALLP